MTEQGEQDKRRWDDFRLPVVVGVAVVGLWLVTPTVVRWLHPLLVDNNELAAAGQFGDLFGALNALFSGLAFVGVIAAILLQSRELKLQREELTAAREEARRSAEAQEVYGRLTALAALLEHYHAIARADGIMKYVVGERVGALAEDLESEYAKATGKAFGVYPPQEPIFVPTGHIIHLKELPEVRDGLPENFVSRLQFVHEVAQERVRGLGCDLFTIGGRPIVFAPPNEQRMVVYWQPGKKPATG